MAKTPRRQVQAFDLDAFEEAGLESPTKVMQMFQKQNNRILKLFEDNSSESSAAQDNQSYGLRLISRSEITVNPATVSGKPSNGGYNNEDLDIFNHIPSDPPKKSSLHIKNLSPIDIVTLSSQELSEPSENLLPKASFMRPETLSEKATVNKSLRRSLFNADQPELNSNCEPVSSTPLRTRRTFRGFFKSLIDKGLDNFSPIKTTDYEVLSPPNEALPSIATIENELREQYQIPESQPSQEPPSRAKTPICTEASIGPTQNETLNKTPCKLMTPVRVMTPRNSKFSTPTTILTPRNSKYSTPTTILTPRKSKYSSPNIVLTPRNTKYSTPTRGATPQASKSGRHSLRSFVSVDRMDIEVSQGIENPPKTPKSLNKTNGNSTKMEETPVVRAHNQKREILVDKELALKLKRCDDTDDQSDDEQNDQPDAMSEDEEQLLEEVILKKSPQKSKKANDEQNDQPDEMSEDEEQLLEEVILKKSPQKSKKANHEQNDQPDEMSEDEEQPIEEVILKKKPQKSKKANHEQNDKPDEMSEDEEQPREEVILKKKPQKSKKANLEQNDKPDEMSEDEEQPKEEVILKKKPQKSKKANHNQNDKPDEMSEDEEQPREEVILKKKPQKSKKANLEQNDKPDEMSEDEEQPRKEVILKKKPQKSKKASDAVSLNRSWLPEEANDIEDQHLEPTTSKQAKPTTSTDIIMPPPILPTSKVVERKAKKQSSTTYSFRASQTITHENTFNDSDSSVGKRIPDELVKSMRLLSRINSTDVQERSDLKIVMPNKKRKVSSKGSTIPSHKDITTVNQSHNLSKKRTLFNAYESEGINTSMSPDTRRPTSHNDRSSGDDHTSESEGNAEPPEAIVTTGDNREKSLAGKESVFKKPKTLRNRKLPEQDNLDEETPKSHRLRKNRTTKDKPVQKESRKRRASPNLEAEISVDVIQRERIRKEIMDSPSDDDIIYDPAKQGCKRGGLRVRRFQKPYWINNPTADNYRVISSETSLRKALKDSQNEKKLKLMAKTVSGKHIKKFLDQNIGSFLDPTQKIKVLQAANLVSYKKLVRATKKTSNGSSRQERKNQQRDNESPAYAESNSGSSAYSGRSDAPSTAASSAYSERSDAPSTAASSAASLPWTDSLSNCILSIPNFSSGMAPVAQSIQTESYDLGSANNVVFRDCGNGLFFGPYIENKSQGIIKLTPGGFKKKSRAKKSTVMFFVIVGEVEVTVNDETHTLGTMGYLSVKPDHHYELQNKTDQDVIINFARV